MSTIPWLPEVLAGAGLRVTLVEGYRTNGRPASTGGFDPIGTLAHHTGATSSRSNPHPALRTLVNGRADLPGPLCHWSPGWDGSVVVVTIGRANHAGKSGGHGPIPKGDGNALLVGAETDTDGVQDMPDEQLEALTVGTAAILHHLGHDAAHAVRHQDTSVTGKWDLGRVTTAAHQAAVAAALRAGAPQVKVTGATDGGPRGPWPFGANHLLGPSRGNATWHDGTRPGERTAVLEWQREVGAKPTGVWARGDTDLVRRTKTWQKAVGLLPTGYPGRAEWLAGTRR